MCPLTHSTRVGVIPTTPALQRSGGLVTQVNVRVDGASYVDDVEPRTLLVHYLREQLGKVGTVVGCDTSNCGACTVHLDGQAVKSCTVLAVQADGCQVTTIEGLAGQGTEGGALHPVQRAFHEMHGLQCGFCTPGMIMASIDLLQENPDPSDEEVREGIEGNLCRCTGYQNIVRAVRHAAAEMRGEAADDPGAAPAVVDAAGEHGVEPVAVQA
jgi:aerobic carbon-monoxide dehydrogenase small subunit